MSEQDPPIPEALAAEGCLYYRALSGERAITVWKMGYGQGYLSVGNQWLHEADVRLRTGAEGCGSRESVER